MWWGLYNRIYINLYRIYINLLDNYVNYLVKYWYLVAIIQSLELLHELVFLPVILEGDFDSLVNMTLGQNIMFSSLQEMLLGGSRPLSCHFKFLLEMISSGYYNPRLSLSSTNKKQAIFRFWLVQFGCIEWRQYI